MLVALSRMDRSALMTSVPAERARGDVRLALRHVRATPALWIPLAAMVLVGTLSFNFQVLMPLLAHSTWHGTATTYAAMTMAMGIGSVAGALLTSTLRSVSSRLIVGAAAAFGIFELLAAAAPSLPLQIARAGAARRRLGHLRRGRQLLAPARRLAGDARARDVAVLDRLPRLDADRRPARRLAGRGRQPARRSRPGRRRRAGGGGRRTRGVRQAGRGHTEGIDPIADTRARRYRLGLIVPSSNVTMETEIPALLRAREPEAPDERFTFHSSRMRMRKVTPEELRAMNEQTGRAAAELADARCDVIATACLVALMAQGPGFHCTAEDQIREVLRAEDAEVPVVSSAGALLDGLRALGARRIAMVTPYEKPLTKLVAEYIEAGGIEVHDALSLEVANNLEVAALDPLALQEHWRRVDLTGCDALVLSACVQMPSLPSIDPVERACGLPVVSAATATTFAMLDALGLSTRIPRAGRLLSGEVAAMSSPA